MNFNKNFKKKDYFQYLNLRRKYLNNNANIYFNLKCKQNKVTPKYAKSLNKVFNKSTKISKAQYEKTRINTEISFLYKKKNYLASKLYEQELRNMNLFGPIWHEVKQLILEKLSPKIQNKYKLLDHKINKLIEQRDKIHTVNNCHKTCKPIQCQFQFHEPIKNLSNITFDKKELEIIQNHYKSNFSVP